MAMDISYSIPLSKGWNRMKKALFQPFDLNKWMRVGFTAFLAGLTDFNGGGNGNSTGNRNVNWNEFFNFPQTAWDWLNSHPVWFTMIVLGVICIFLFVVFLTWLSSRGKFMFLSNVVNNTDGISKPWNEYRKEGNTLFVWRFFYGLIAFFIFAGLLVMCFTRGMELYTGDVAGIVIFWNVFLMVLVFLGLLVVFGYVSLFLNDFVVPVMYKERIGPVSAWFRFLKLFGKYPVTFLIYGLFIAVLFIAAVLGILFFGVFTCCIGFILLIIPYIGSVVLLPVSYTFRALSLEFLAQFGDEYNLLLKPEESVEIIQV